MDGTDESTKIHGQIEGPLIRMASYKIQSKDEGDTYIELVDILIQQSYGVFNPEETGA